MSRNKVHLWGTHSATILGITLVLFMLGLLLVIEYHSYRLTHDAQEQITYKVDLSPDVSDSLAIAFSAEVRKMDYVKQVDYISKEKAAQIFSEELDEDFVGFIGYNPLYPSLMVNFYADLLPDNSTDILDQFCSEVSSRSFVLGVSYQENVVNDLREVFYKLSWFLIVFVALLLLITVVLISSLIRIAVYNQRDTIATMRLVGAKASFIARPFLWRSVAYGALGGLFASMLTLATVWVFDNQFELSAITYRHWMGYGIISLVLVLSGIVVCYLATAITVRHHISKN